eukprot:scaffold57104_cov17-Prasinocladus_malaysianus.AAC.2
METMVKKCLKKMKRSVRMKRLDGNVSIGKVRQNEQAHRVQIRGMMHVNDIDETDTCMSQVLVTVPHECCVDAGEQSHSKAQRGIASRKKDEETERLAKRLATASSCSKYYRQPQPKMIGAGEMPVCQPLTMTHKSMDNKTN